MGHAIETVSGYRTFLHGEAISIGMAFAGRLSSAVKGFPVGECERLVRLLQRAGLPTEAPEYAWAELRMVMGVDKKSTAGQPRFVLAERLGRVVTGCDVAEDVLQQVWQQKVVPRAHGF
jgi:3-dehydroquinate synthase